MKTAAVYDNWPEETALQIRQRIAWAKRSMRWANARQTSVLRDHIATCRAALKHVTA